MLTKITMTAASYKFILRWFLIALAAVWSAATMTAAVRAEEEALVKPVKVNIAPGTPKDEAETTLKAALRYYTFWNTGEERYARAALSPNFVDLNLPKGRAQGPEGPLAGSKGFRAAVPDLTCVAEEVWVQGNQVIGRLRLAGHFTGTFGKLQGKGQPISFQAVDIYTVEDGKIATNWHLEDMLTLMQQIGAVPAE
jgi:predicted ester cyclase